MTRRELLFGIPTVAVLGALQETVSKPLVRGERTNEFKWNQDDGRWARAIYVRNVDAEDIPAWSVVFGALPSQNFLSAVTVKRIADDYPVGVTMALLPPRGFGWVQTQGAMNVRFSGGTSLV